MPKDFDAWNEKIKQIQERKSAPYFHEREIWWCSLGINVGNEIDGSGNGYARPVLIIKVLSNRTCVIVPLTSATDKHPLRIDIGNLAKELYEKIRKTVKDIF